MLCLFASLFENINLIILPATIQAFSYSSPDLTVNSYFRDMVDFTDFYAKTDIGAVCKIDKFFFATITTHFLIDIAILVLPIVPIFKLHLRLQQRFATISFFLLGTM